MKVVVCPEKRSGYKYLFNGGFSYLSTGNLKSFNVRLLQIFSFLLLIIVVQSCADKAGSWKNEQINAGKREDFHKLNDEAFKYIKANDPKGLQSLLCKELIDDSHTERLVELISSRLNDDKYSMLDEYYVINKYKDYDTIFSKGKDINSYSLNYPGITREMYITFFVPKTSENKYMVSIAYAKYNYGWKISTLDLEPYTINGKTGPELFKLAKEQYSKHYLIDAVNNIALALTCFKPSEIWQYPNEGEISVLNGKVINEANERYKFPFTLNQVTTKPQIIRIYNQINADGAYPVVYYLSKINLKDTLAIRRENEQIKKVIGKAMPGIDKDKKYVFYAAFNQRPTGYKTVDHYDMTDKLP